MVAEKLRVLVTVKTYPNPSSTYDETVCAAGIDTERRRFVRLYPIRFRHLDYDKWFSKYDVLEMDVQRHKSDPRQDTFTPDASSIRRVGHVTTGPRRRPDWAERNAIVLPLARTLEDLTRLVPTKTCSLGVVPMFDAELVAEPDDPVWTPEQLAILNRDQLFGRKLTPLEKVPWKFYYAFRSSPGGPRHRLQFLDWEAYQLYRNQRERHSSEKAIDDVLRKYNVDYSADKKNLHLYVGTHFRWQHEFMGIGLYYPPHHTD